MAYLPFPNVTGNTKDGALRTLYRINVGGPEVKDTLWRNWVPDADYLAYGGSGANHRSFYGELHYRSQGLILQQIALDSVYITCGEASVENITWRFNRAKPVKAEFLYGKGRSPSWITERTENASSNVTNLNLKLKMSLAEILAATHNFNPKLLIGEGGFGKVYKGTLESGMKVAVKRSDSSHGQGLPEFQTEVMVLSKIQHRHLVSLVGYCDEGSEMILVFEFMEKGTLRDHLYSRKECLKNPSAKTELTWKQRLEICIGSAKGLHYLHTGPDGGIFHRDVKSTNILLDEHYVAKVADFGLSQQGMPDPDHISMGFKGTFGYLDPQYFRTFQLTNKSDVYAFGVVLLEVLCARPPVVDSQQKEEINLAERGMFWQKEGQLEKIIDPLLPGHINPNSLRKFGQIVEKCLKPHGADMPNMHDVCWDLEYAMQLQQTAVHREAHEDTTITGVSSDSALPELGMSGEFGGKGGLEMQDEFFGRL
ncbi:hypothetical protein NC651_013560 [Populus alba x Populus x berolinensis]|nr:hypothetical protein NC651_013560 [Populus alba x Populus x berolinensis]